jgi:lipoprotein-anchoring transpeptidase ErfK/SrfK
MTLRIEIDIGDQQLRLYGADGACIRRYPVSTALNGPGEQLGSGCTPRGEHLIRARIGADMPADTVFSGRRPTGEQWSVELAEAHPERDWILARILWLSGTQVGVNRLGNCDSMRRYIYIHGTPDTEPMGIARSHGCVRMRTHEVIELFDLVTAGTPVSIRE